MAKENPHRTGPRGPCGPGVIEVPRLQDFSAGVVVGTEGMAGRRGLQALPEPDLGSATGEERRDGGDGPQERHDGERDPATPGEPADHASSRRRGSTIAAATSAANVAARVATPPR